jgi:outer membrane receptor protein involved in Fe transport
LNEKQNLRLGYSETVNRPEFRELAPFVFYDFTNGYTYSGNDTLQRCKIYNYDVRYEFFPGRNQLLSGSLFYKQFINPIEQKSNPNQAREVTYINASSATNYGFEIEFRVLLASLLNIDSNEVLNNLSIFSNYAFIESNVIVNSADKTIDKDRRLQGQSPYVLNAGIQYQNAKKGYSATISCNSVGDRISIVGNVNEPSLWEKGRTVVDLQIAKTFFKGKGEIRLNAKDIFVQELIFYNDMNDNQQYDKDKDLKIISRNFGNEFSASFSYKF